MVAPLIIPAATTAAGLIGSSIFGKKKKSSDVTVTQEPLLTDWQKNAMNALQKYYQSGKFGGYTAGEGYGGALGNYDMSALEGAGQNKLSQMLAGFQPPSADMSGALGTLGLGKAELQNLLSGSSMYDPTKEGGLYEGFKRNTLRANQEAADRLKAQAAYGGKLMSSSTGKELGLLNERTSNSLQDMLAQLSDVYAQRRLGGIGMAQGLAGAEANIMGQGANIQNLGQQMGLNLVGASQQYGGLQRMLADTQAKEQYNEWLRQHKELGDVVGSAEKMAYTSPQWGSQSMTIPGQYQDNPWANLFNTMSGMGGQMMGQYYGNQLQNNSMNQWLTRMGYPS